MVVTNAPFSSRKLSFFWQIFLPVSIIIAIGTAISFGVRQGVEKTGQSIHKFYDYYFSVHLDTHALEKAFALHHLLLLQHVSAESASEMAAIEREIAASQQTIKKHLNQIRQRNALLGHGHDFLAAYRDSTVIFEQEKKIVELSRDFEKESAFALLNTRINPLIRDMTRLASQHHARDGEEIVGLMQSVAEVKNKNAYLSALSICLSVLFSALLAVLLARRLSAEVGAIVQYAGELGKGNFTARPPQHSVAEIGYLVHSLNTMSANLARSFTRQREINRELAAKAEALEHSEARLRDERQRLEEANLKLQAEITNRQRLEEEAAQRQQQLIEADKLASLGVLVAGVAHEINNPNNFITINAPILQDAFDDMLPILDQQYAVDEDFVLAGLPYPQMRDHIPTLFNGITEGTRRINRIVSHLKDYARQDRFDHTEDVDINQVARAVLVLLANPIRQSTDNLQVNLGADIPTFKGNFQRVEQVLVNIVNNGCQALTAPDQALSITTTYDRKRAEIRAVIQDAGVGIPRENLKHVLDPFFTTKRDIRGTGLGLSIAAGIMREHGGRLEFQSEVDKGTTVTAFFPTATPP